MNKKEVINADEFEFKIEPMPHKQAYGLFVYRTNYPRTLLCQKNSINECYNWIFAHFIGEKGTKFNIKIDEGKIEKETGLIY